jgi:hypothetical protein
MLNPCGAPWDKQLLRREPTLEPRVVAGLPVRMLLPSALNNGSIYINQSVINGGRCFSTFFSHAKI